MEHYITIEGYPNYEISNLGNVKNKKTGVVRKLTNRRGYLKVRLDNRDESVHRLVAGTFFDCPDFANLQVNHIDGNKTNNFLGNLEIVTPSENVKHAFKKGLKRPSGGCPSKAIYDETTNVTYSSIKECAKHIPGTRAGIVYSLKHNKPYKNHNLKMVGVV